MFRITLSLLMRTSDCLGQGPGRTCDQGVDHFLKAQGLRGGRAGVGPGISIFLMFGPVPFGKTSVCS